MKLWQFILLSMFFLFRTIGVSTLGKKNFFLSHARDKTKTIFLYFFTELKTYPLSYSIKDQAHRPGLEIEVVHFKFGLFSGS